jgi:hypothetical protein
MYSKMGMTEPPSFYCGDAMSDDSNALLALKNAWNGAVAASDRVRELAPSVLALADSVSLDDLDLDTYHTVALAQANAVQALRGLIEQLRRKHHANDEPDEDTGAEEP